MALSREQKEQQYTELSEKMSKSLSLAFVENSGLSVENMEKVRCLLREKNAEMKVGKKSIIRKVIAEKKIAEAEIPDAVVGGAIMVVFSYEDAIAGPKVIYDFSKKEKETIALRGGIMDKVILSETEVMTLASLPSKEELLAKLMGSMMSPVSGFMGVSNNLISGFVRVLDGHCKNQENV